MQVYRATVYTPVFINDVVFIMLLLIWLAEHSAFLVHEFKHFQQQSNCTFSFGPISGCVPDIIKLETNTLCWTMTLISLHQLFIKFLHSRLICGYKLSLVFPFHFPAYLWHLRLRNASNYKLEASHCTLTTDFRTKCHLMTLLTFWSFLNVFSTTCLPSSEF